VLVVHLHWLQDGYSADVAAAAAGSAGKQGGIQDGVQQ